MYVFQPMGSFAVACLKDDVFWYHQVEDLHLVASTNKQQIPSCVTLVVHRPVSDGKQFWHVSEKACGARIQGVEEADRIHAIDAAILAIRKYGVGKYARQVKKHKADNDRRLEAIRMGAKSVP